MPHDLITSDPKTMMGKPTVAGTRITVELSLEKLAAGESIQQIHVRTPASDGGSDSSCHLPSPQT